MPNNTIDVNLKCFIFLYYKNQSWICMFLFLIVVAHLWWYLFELEQKLAMNAMYQMQGLIQARHMLLIHLSNPLY